MKRLLILIFSSAMLFISYSDSYALRRGKSITPYGGTCARCGHYGMCKSEISTEDAVKAMKQYYGKKDLNIEILSVEGKFIKANVKHRDRVLDVIIFDRRTGRIRSTY